ncbi:MAG TPA: hypothetical protein VFV83_04005 [Chthoniobacteraceae bacterium]|nr:hypothetical protein [Chthoniobacteraceae bacterium]
MSLKAFHIIFILLAIGLSVVCAAWSFGNAVAIPFGVCSLAVAVTLVIYGIWFIRKSRRIIT